MVDGGDNSSSYNTTLTHVQTNMLFGIRLSPVLPTVRRPIVVECCVIRSCEDGLFRNNSLTYTLIQHTYPSLLCL